jgi:hypothetical protein
MFENLEFGVEATETEPEMIAQPDCFAVRQYKKYKLAAGVV